MSITKVLDRSRPFGVVVGSSNGAVHHQDGCSFGSDDREIGAPKLTPAPDSTATEATDPTPVDPNPAAVTREELQALHVSQIKKLVLNAGLEYITGAGSKAKNIEQLLA
jgi:hypothetical protein